MSKTKRVQKLIEELNPQELNELTLYLNESKYTRAAQTDAQERAITKVEKWIKKCDEKIKGGTTVGKHPQTLILDVLAYQGGEVSIDDDGEIRVNEERVKDFESFKKELLGGEEEVPEDEWRKY